MAFDLKSAARAKGIKRKRVELRPVVPTNVLENELFAIYADSLRIWSQCMTDLLANYVLPTVIDGMTSDADGAQLQWLVDQANRKADGTILYQTDKLGKWVTRVGNWHGQKTIGSVKSALGVDIEPFIRLSDVQSVLDDTLRANVSLIRDVNAKNRSAIEQALYDAFVNRRSKKELTDALASILGTSKKRARFIAGDQVHKLSIALTAFRNQQLGIDTYKWETVRDDRVRKSHRARQGDTFRWDAPPFDGPPGFAPGCRCHAAPILELD